ncbi:hypothetical protein WA026_020659 [Henosepilachna vigintioctopunctata]|uniref:ATPase family AAA domain-containing protein n=1 Tax=Henosepilachna vigintioctopunctata TaxID=420089 RepID=A0AAW1UBI0_9CUCU
MKLKYKNEMKRVGAELEAEARICRENRDLTLDQVRLKASENEMTLLESIKTDALIGIRAQALVTHSDKVTAGGSSLTVFPKQGKSNGEAAGEFNNHDMPRKLCSF